MRINEIRVDGLRNLQEVVLRPRRGINHFTGLNGAGKTSLLEALHLLAHGRSFRSSAVDTLIRRGGSRFTILADFVDAQGRDRRHAMQRGPEGWVLRQDGQPVSTLIEFVRGLAVITLEPESHQLLTGSSEGRRRFLDWLLFHVEPDFLACWRRYLRALRQRNAALKVPGQAVGAIEAWERELAVSGEQIDSHRRSVLEALANPLGKVSKRLSAAWPDVGVRYRSGWPAGLPLLDALAEGRASDRDRGFTQRGPHRSDWRLVFPDGSPHNQLSRGQAKLLAQACLLAQGELYTQRKGELPIYACDDLGAELDRQHQAGLMAELVATGAQVFITSTGPLDLELPESPAKPARFHVEQGRIGPLL